MKSAKKGLYLAMLVMGNVSIVPIAQAKLSMSSFTKKTQDLFNRTKTDATGVYDSLKGSLNKTHGKVTEMWNNLPPETQSAIIAALTTAGAAAVASGTGYAISHAMPQSGKPAEGPSFDDIWNKMPSNDQKEVLNKLGEMNITMDDLKVVGTK